MANRPRRPKTGNGPSETDAGPFESSNAPILDGAPEADPLPVDVDASGPADTAGSNAISTTSGSTGDPAASKGPRSLPPLDEQPGTAPEAIRQQRTGEDARTELTAETGAPDDTAGSADDADASATQIFAAEEGLSSKAGEPPRRHLGEFEDDETLAASEPHDTHSSPVTDAYRTGADGSQVGETPPARATTGSLVGAGLAGAVLALLGGSLLVYAGLLPSGGQASAPGQYAEAGDLQGLSSEVATLREAVAQLQSAEAAGGSGTSYASASDLAAVSDRLAAAEQAVQDRPDTVDTSALNAVVAGATSAQDAADTAQTTADEARSLAAQAQARADEAQSLSNETQTRLADLTTRLDELESAQLQSRTALAAAGLKSAIDRGGPFEPELEGFAAAGGGEEAVEPLRAFAATGVPTQIELAAEWTSVEADIRRAIIQPDAEAGVGSQLLAGLSSLVTVRSTGPEAEGDPAAPEATLGRMRDALASGDLDGWLGERETLDEAGRSASQSFAERVEARRQALSIVDTALTQATGATPAREG